MKLLLSLILLLSSVSIFSQINTFNPSATQEVYTMPSPEPYDSLKNICVENFHCLIGQNIQFLPYKYVYDGPTFIGLYKKDPTKYFLNSEDLYCKSLYFGSSKLEALLNKVFRIVDYKIKEKHKATSYSKAEYDYFLTVIEPETNDTLYMSLGIHPNVNGLVIEGYFEKLRSLKIGEKLITKSFSNRDWASTEKEVWDCATNQLVTNLSEGEIFTIKDIAYIPGQYAPELVYILQNESRENCYTPASAICFMDYEKYIVEEQKKTERRRMLVNKYGAKNGALIADGQVRLGFSKAMCKEAWGEPTDINTSTGAWGPMNNGYTVAEVIYILKMDA